MSRKLTNPPFDTLAAQAFADCAIAAIASAHGFLLATRNTCNTRDFRDAGISIVNPWAADDFNEIAH